MERLKKSKQIIKMDFCIDRNELTQIGCYVISQFSERLTSLEDKLFDQKEQILKLEEALSNLVDDIYDLQDN